MLGKYSNSIYDPKQHGAYKERHTDSGKNDCAGKNILISRKHNRQKNQCIDDMARRHFPLVPGRKVGNNKKKKTGLSQRKACKQVKEDTC